MSSQFLGARASGKLKDYQGAQAFFESVRKGKGVVVYHYGLGFRPEMNDEYERLCGGAWRPRSGAEEFRGPVSP